MLVLTRRPGQRIVIDANGTPVELLIVSVRGDAVRVGIQADKETVRILREELVEKELTHA